MKMMSMVDYPTGPFTILEPLKQEIGQSLIQFVNAECRMFMLQNFERVARVTWTESLKELELELELEREERFHSFNQCLVS